MDKGAGIFFVATAFLIGMTLHRITGLLWVVDFRDPILQEDYPETNVRRRIFGWIESEAIFRCEKAVFTTHSAMAFYKSRYPERLHQKFSVIENGFDEDSFSVAESISLLRDPESRGTNRITLLHSGALLEHGRNPSAFLEAISKLKRLAKVDSSTLRVVFRATGDDAFFHRMVSRFGVADIVCIEPPLEYIEGLNEMLNVDGLLLFQGSAFNLLVPAKVYEYFRAKRPIFGLIDLCGETARKLLSSGILDVTPIDSSEKIASDLDGFLEKIPAGKAAIVRQEVLDMASRDAGTDKLAEIFDEISACTQGAESEGVGYNDVSGAN